MPDWEHDSAVLRGNLVAVLRQIRDDARHRVQLTVDHALVWHDSMLTGLDVPNPAWKGAFRGPPTLPHCEVGIGRHAGVASGRVAEELRAFELRLQRATGRLDTLLPSNHEPTTDSIAATIDVMAWAHASWVRIHPFAHANGRTARLWANAIAMRYEIPPFVRLRPRPNDGYEAAAIRAMDGDWQPTVAVFNRMLAREIAERARR